MKKLLLLPIIFLLSVVFANATADCNMTVFASGNQSFFNVTSNVTNDGGTAINNVTVFIEGKSAKGLNTSYSIITDGNITNTSNRAQHINYTLGNHQVLPDASDWVFRANCFINNSALHSGVSSESSSRLLDRRSPNPPTGITYSSPVGDGQTITATINRLAANSCFVRFGSPTAPRYAMTMSAASATATSTCTYTVSKNNPVDSSYAMFVEASDDVNATQSAQQNIDIDAVQSDGGGLFGGTLVTTSGSSSTQSILGGNNNPFAPNKKVNPVVVIIVLGLLYMVFKKK